MFQGTIQQVLSYLSWNIFLFAFPKEEWGEGEDKKFHFQYFPACPQILTLKNISYSSTRCCDQIQGSMRSEKEIALHLTTADLDPLLSHLHEAHGMEEIGQRMGFSYFHRCT